MVVAALLVLALLFAGHWIISYVTDGNPWTILPWFGIAAAVIILLGLFTFLRRKSGGDGR
jgi:LPXTG-motif cell wall-anchored protein